MIPIADNIMLANTDIYKYRSLRDCYMKNVYWNLKYICKRKKAEGMYYRIQMKL